MNVEASAVPVAPECREDRINRVDLVLIGARGQVGSAFRRQLARQAASLRGEGLDLRLIAAFDRRGLAFDEDGLASAHIEVDMQMRKPGDQAQLLEYLRGGSAHRPMVIDCTASDEIADLYMPLLAASIGVVAANKRANARDLHSYRELQRLSRENRVPYCYETTVGAAIPLLGPLRDLRLRGEQATSIQGVLSGSLSYILHRLHEGCPFSTAVENARQMGYTEPNPLEDLRAVDLSRKLLVLAREAGFMLELEDLVISPLTESDHIEIPLLVDSLRGDDAAWAKRVAEAEARAERLVVMAQVDRHGGRIGLQSVSASSSYAQMLPGENRIVIHTELQDTVPLSLGGPGAGVEITAAGVLSDIVSAAFRGAD
ncbi:hypothetical protein [Stenotrophomonas sp. P5_B8]